MICVCPHCNHVFESAPTTQQVEPIKPFEIIDMCRKYFGVSEILLKGRKRDRDLAACRHLAVYLIDKHCNYTKSNIARLLNRDHTTVIHAIKRVNNSLFTKMDLYDDLKYLEREIEARIGSNPLKVAI